MFPAALAKNPTSGPWLHLVLTSCIRLSANPVGSVNLNPKPKSFRSSLASSCLHLATVISCLGESSGPFTGLQPQPLPSCSPSIQQPERSFGNRNRITSPSALTLLLFQLKPQPRVGRPSLCHPPLCLLFLPGTPQGFFLSSLFSLPLKDFTVSQFSMPWIC